MSDESLIGDEEFASRVRDALNTQTLAPELADRLAAARRRAVASVDAPIPRAPSVWIPVGALASTLLVVGMFSAAIERKSAPPFDDDVQFAAAQDLDLLDDLEFVAWLDSDDTDAS
jgi:hypothetical protein